MEITSYGLASFSVSMPHPLYKFCTFFTTRKGGICTTIRCKVLCTYCLYIVHILGCVQQIKATRWFLPHTWFEPQLVPHEVPHTFRIDLGCWKGSVQCEAIGGVQAAKSVSSWSTGFQAMNSMDVMIPKGIKSTCPASPALFCTGATLGSNTLFPSFFMPDWQRSRWVLPLSVLPVRMSI